ncbi:MAG: hypothetical protein FJ125_11485 [Deltaproteobacteria bacterium]|nr:hypothetical protein [Deltaproteobacteria bacterium]
MQQGSHRQRPAPGIVERCLAALAEAGFVRRGLVELPPKDAVYAPVPRALDQRLRGWLTRRYPSGLYSHQALALAALLEGKDACLTTRTASSVDRRGPPNRDPAFLACRFLSFRLRDHPFGS